MQLILIRGLPGCGKTTLGELLDCDNGYLFSTDDYFMDDDGNYAFNANELRTAHEHCQNRTIAAMIGGAEVVIVANTFTQEWEMTPYLKAADDLGYMVHTIIVENRHGGVNVHNVPDEAMDRMEGRFSVKLR